MDKQFQSVLTECQRRADLAEADPLQWAAVALGLQILLKIAKEKSLMPIFWQGTSKPPSWGILDLPKNAVLGGCIHAGGGKFLIENPHESILELRGTEAEVAFLRGTRIGCIACPPPPSDDDGFFSRAILEIFPEGQIPAGLSNLSHADEATEGTQAMPLGPSEN